MKIKDLKAFIKDLPDDATVDIELSSYSNESKFVKTSVSYLKTESGESMYYSSSSNQFEKGTIPLKIVICGEQK